MPQQTGIAHVKRRDFIASTAAAAFTCSAHDAYAQNEARSCGRSTAEEVTAGVDLSGKVAVVTGCSSGIGFETMRVLALRGAHVIGAARSIQSASAACRRVPGRTTPAALELSDFGSVVECATEILRLGSAIDIVVLNAGIVLGSLEQVGGVEKQFVVNHLGHFLLTAHLLERVKAAEQARIIVVGSGSHRNAPSGGIQFDDLSGRSWHEKGYAHSKLANGLFSLELARRLKGSRATSNCVSPGHTRTNILKNAGAEYRADAKTPEQGAAAICYAACAASLAKVSGQYMADCQIAPQSAEQRDATMAAKLWKISAELTNCSARLCGELLS